MWPLNIVGLICFLFSHLLLSSFKNGIKKTNQTTRAGGETVHSKVVQIIGTGCTWRPGVGGAKVHDHILCSTRPSNIPVKGLNLNQSANVSHSCVKKLRYFMILSVFLLHRAQNVCVVSVPAHQWPSDVWHSEVSAVIRLWRRCSEATRWLSRSRGGSSGGGGSGHAASSSFRVGGCEGETLEEKSTQPDPDGAC